MEGFGEEGVGAEFLDGGEERVVGPAESSRRCDAELVIA